MPISPDEYECPLTVGQLASRSGVAVSAIHYYESQGLIKGWRTGGNQRRYHRDTLRRVAVIKTAQQLGIALSEIRKAMDSLPDGRTPTASDWRKLSSLWRNELDRRIELLQVLRGRLTECIGCGCLSLQKCHLRNSWDKLGDQGPGAQLIKQGKQFNKRLVS